jgi:hypothetical protein
MSRQCGILNISQTTRPPRPVTGIALLFTFTFTLTYFSLFLQGSRLQATFFFCLLKKCNTCLPFWSYYGGGSRGRVRRTVFEFHPSQVRLHPSANLYSPVLPANSLLLQSVVITCGREIFYSPPAALPPHNISSRKNFNIAQTAPHVSPYACARFSKYRFKQSIVLDLHVLTQLTVNVIL